MTKCLLMIGMAVFVYTGNVERPSAHCSEVKRAKKESFIRTGTYISETVRTHLFLLRAT